jgi:hypothetical protein
VGADAAKALSGISTMTANSRKLLFSLIEIGSFISGSRLFSVWSSLLDGIRACNQRKRFWRCGSVGFGSFAMYQ